MRKPDNARGNSGHSSSDRRLLCVVAHPDDESWAMGGLLALASRAKFNVNIAIATKGEAGLDLTKRTRPGPGLAELRTAEMEMACRILGTEPPRWGDFGDGYLPKNIVGLHRWLGDLVDSIRPDVVVGLGLDGGYGHLDHVALAKAVRQAIATSPEDSRPTLLEAAFPLGLLAQIHKKIKKSVPEMVTKQTPTGIVASEAHLVFDISSVDMVKRQAVAAHASQCPDGNPDKFLQAGIFDTLGGREWYVVSSAPRGGVKLTELFAGVPCKFFI